MKYLYYFIIFISFSIKAEELNIAYIDLVHASHLDTAMSESYVNSIIATVDAQLKENSISSEITTKQKNEMLKSAAAYFSSSDHINNVATIYAKIYTIEEATDLASFYRSKVGIKFVRSVHEFESMFTEMQEKSYGPLTDKVIEIRLRNVK